MGLRDGVGIPATRQYLEEAEDKVHVYLDRLNISMTALVWQEPFLSNNPHTYLFTITFATQFLRPIKAEVPVAILTSDGILRFLIEPGTVDLKEEKESAFPKSKQAWREVTAYPPDYPE